MFELAPPHQDDPIESTFLRAKADPRPDLIDLSIGVFKDASGNAPIMATVRRAEMEVLGEQATKCYLSPAGNPDYCHAISRLVLGAAHPVLTGDRLQAVQTPGAGAALRVAAELIRFLKPDAAIWFSDPVWDHQPDFFTRAGLPRKIYRYYDRTNHTVDFDCMLTDLRAAARGDVVVLHGACHNPTGADLSVAQWRELALFCREHGLLPLVDIAYQGYGDGIEEDVAGVREMAVLMPEMLIAISSSKSFAVYRDRAGALMMLTPEGGRKAEELRLHVTDLIRALYFMPPDHGAAVITRILEDDTLRTGWAAELDAARAQVTGLRGAFQAMLQRAVNEADFTWLGHQKGMFSCLPLTEENRFRLERDQGVYLMPGGRINFAALSEEKIERLAAFLPDYLTV